MRGRLVDAHSRAFAGRLEATSVLGRENCASPHENRRTEREQKPTGERCRFGPASMLAVPLTDALVDAAVG
jgi:hypothetical protein